MEIAKIEDLLGKTLKSATMSGDNETIDFETESGQSYRMKHDQDCCETVSVESVVGDLADLIGNPVLQAEEVSGSNTPAPDGLTGNDDSYTWTFYKLGTIKGSVTIRWLGTSNGYYSESVYFYKVSEAA